MRRFGILALAAMFGLGLAGPAHGQEGAAAAGKKPISALAWVVGGVWVADTSRLGGGMRRIETRYEWSDNGAYIRFNTHFISDQGTLKNYDGNFFWEAAEKSFRVWYVDAGNSITQGPLSVDANHWQLAFRGEDFEGKQADLRVDVAIKSNDLYHWTLSEKSGEVWKTLLELDYMRKPVGT